LLDLDFVKSHGLGNDYVVVDAAHFGITLTPERVRLLCHRHLGLGSDGILEVTAADDRFVVRIWNPDGSLAERSGNGLRIVAKFLSDHGYTDESAFSIETVVGPVRTEVYRADGRVEAVRLEMGKAAIDRAVTALPPGSSSSSSARRWRITRSSPRASTSSSPRWSPAVACARSCGSGARGTRWRREPALARWPPRASTAASSGALCRW
jgi:diaminopimelate epimerase